MERSKNYRLKFIKYIKGEHVDYQIKLICLDDSNINVEFMERYSNMKELHEVFKKEAKSINFPKFPPKKFFGNTDDIFLSQRQTALEHYFTTILGSKEFSTLPSLKKWIDGLIKKHDKKSGPEKTSDKMPEKVDNKEEQKKNRTNSNSNNDSRVQQSFSRNNDIIQRCKEVVDVYSKNFIDLGNDNNPQFEIEDSLAKEKNYKLLLKTHNVFDKSNSRFFVIPAGDNGRLECLGLEEPKIQQYETMMLSKLNLMSRHISSEITEEYTVEELITRI